MYKAAVAVLGLQGISADSLTAQQPGMEGLLRDPRREVRLAACEALLRFGPEVHQIPALVACLTDGSPLVRRTASQALQKLGSAAVPFLTAQLRQAGPGMRSAALEVLGQLRPASPSLAKCVADSLD
ncbi:unnamed protein product, partial [Polarella glacialis]